MGVYNRKVGRKGGTEAETKEFLFIKLYFPSSRFPGLEHTK